MSGPTWLPPKQHQHQQPQRPPGRTPPTPGTGGPPPRTHPDHLGPPRTHPDHPGPGFGPAPVPSAPDQRYPPPRAPEERASAWGGPPGAPQHLQGRTADRGPLSPRTIEAEIDSLTSVLADLDSGRGHAAPRRPDAQVYEPPRPPAYRPGPPKSVGGSHPTPRAPAPPYGGPTPASYATASTPAGPAFPVQVKVAQPVRGYSQPRRGAQQAYGAPTAPQPPPAGRAEAWEAGYRGRAEPGGKEDRPRGAHPIGAGGGGSYLPKAPPSRPPEEEVERLTKKLVHDMNHPPPSGEYFGRCGGCGEDVVGDGAGVVALDRVFHVGCFVCATCHARLRGQHFYAVERRAFCEDCYLVTLEKCAVCSQPILDRILRAMGKAYHPACFTCVVCHRGLDGVPFTVDATSQIHCIDDFHRKFAPRCSVCAGAIMPEPGQEETVRIVALDRSFHVGCYKCEECGLLLSAEGECQGCYPLDGHILCKACSAWRIQELSATVTTDC
ncbi:thyroid receptor-interacting protein 6 [Ornithorhynchus anatinus]|uniref:thyroid receptor-interacting protein 6 n=1 Tax=Ornithorhynchus anatinus TaxID=9258 RepID=UPI0010A754A3|nr:thyroid receptor-interacting protein 6 [Ornithorhynchus anatinus]